MTKEQARIVVLEDALVQSYHTISFLFGCLESPSPNAIEEMKAKVADNGGYHNAYPDQTRRRLEAIERLVPIPKGCIHSKLRTTDCEACRDHLVRLERLGQARRVLGADHAT